MIALHTKKIYTWKEAFEDAHRAAMAGRPPSQTFVGYCYDIGRGVRQNLKLARRWFEKAASNGNVAGIFNLAVMNDMGQGMRRRNARRAVDLYRQAALRGDVKSQTNLAVMLLDGDGVKKNVSEGLRWLRRAAQRGDDKAQYNLGRTYLDGEDVRKNKTLARKWLAKAAKQGHFKARRLLKSARLKSGLAG